MGELEQQIQELLRNTATVYEPTQPNKSKTILFVDDETSILQLYGEGLASQGYKVITTDSGKTATQLLHLKSEIADIVILDIKLKGESGIEIFSNMLKKGIKIPVILHSAFSCYKDDFIPWLANGYVVKSSDPAELYSEIGRCLTTKP